MLSYTRHTFTTLGIFLLYLWFLGAGGLWVTSSRILPDGLPREVAVAVFGVAFAAAFLWLLVIRLRRLFAGHGTVLNELVIAAINLALLIMAFASIYQTLGVIDATISKQPTSHNFWSAMYFSVVTFTTLGYGDFRPIGIGRLIASVEAFTGYIVLAITASTAAELLKIQGKEQAQKKNQEEQSPAIATPEENSGDGDDSGGSGDGGGG